MRLPLASLLALSLVSTAFAGKPVRYSAPIDAPRTLVARNLRLDIFIEMMITTIDRCTTKNTDSHECWSIFYGKMNGAMGGDTDYPNIVNPLINAAIAGSVSSRIPKDWVPSPFPTSVDPIGYRQKEPSSGMLKQAVSFYELLYNIALNGCSPESEELLRASIASFLTKFLKRVYGPDKYLSNDDKLHKELLNEEIDWLRRGRPMFLHIAKPSTKRPRPREYISFVFRRIPRLTTHTQWR
jgi:hypothetical protein